MCIFKQSHLFKGISHFICLIPKRKQHYLSLKHVLNIFVYWYTQCHYHAAFKEYYESLFIRRTVYLDDMAMHSIKILLDVSAIQTSSPNNKFPNWTTGNKNIG